jgi:hypothetical protein
VSATADPIFHTVTITFSESVTIATGEDGSVIDFFTGSDAVWTGGTGAVQTCTLGGANPGDQCCINGLTSAVSPAPTQQFFTLT